MSISIILLSLLDECIKDRTRPVSHVLRSPIQDSTACDRNMASGPTVVGQSLLFILESDLKCDLVPWKTLLLHLVLDTSTSGTGLSWFKCLNCFD